MQTNWRTWREFFEARRLRPLPALPTSRDAAGLDAGHEALGRLLARFHAGETGEGRIVDEVRRHPPRGTDADYHAALDLFIREEGRHARILGEALRAQGGSPQHDHWTKEVFAHGRRVAGPRLELLVLHVAEIVGIGCYQALAEVLRDDELRTALEEIANDERAHLDFHNDFFAHQLNAGLSPRAFRAGFLGITSAAIAMLVVDAGADFAALGVTRHHLARRLWRLARPVPGEVERRALEESRRRRKRRAACLETSTA